MQLSMYKYIEKIKLVHYRLFLAVLWCMFNSTQYQPRIITRKIKQLGGGVLFANSNIVINKIYRLLNQGFV